MISKKVIGVISVLVIISLAFAGFAAASNADSEECSTISEEPAVIYGYIVTSSIFEGVSEDVSDAVQYVDSANTIDPLN